MIRFQQLILNFANFAADTVSMVKHSGNLIFVLFILLTGCGKLSNVVDLNFQSVINDTPTAPVKSSPFLGLQAAAGTRTSGKFKLEAGIGNQFSSAVKTNGAFKFYGGIQGQVVSQ